MVARRRYEARTATAAAWLFAIAHHKLTDYQRRGSTEDRMRSRLGMEPSRSSAEDAEMIRWLGDEVASQMVEDLPPDQREAIRAHVLEDRDYAEIARSERLSEATVRKRVSRGLRVLRERARRGQMSSDYIPRLRQELLRAGATQPSRFRRPRPARALRPLAGVAAVGARRRGRGARAPARRRADGRAGRPHGRAQLPRRPLRSGVGGAGDARAARDSGVRVRRVHVARQPHDHRSASARADVAALAAAGRFAIYDWEAQRPRAARCAGAGDATA
jgi:RNA polymerase sigma factor (sigma-70 family)